MENNVKLTKVTINDEGEAFIPCKISIRLINRPTLKAVAKLEYAGFIINDIRITERYGKTTITFPSNVIERKDGQKRTVAFIFPADRDLSKYLNHAILNAYTNKCMEEINHITDGEHLQNAA